MVRGIFLAGLAGVVVYMSGVLDDGPARPALMLLPLSAAVAYGMLSAR